MTAPGRARAAAAAVGAHVMPRPGSAPARRTARLNGAPSHISWLRNARQCVVERRKPGRPSKGDRGHISALLPRPLLAAAHEHAALTGMTLTDLIGELLAAEVGVPYQTQEALTRTV